MPDYKAGSINYILDHSFVIKNDSTLDCQRIIIFLWLVVFIDVNHLKTYRFHQK